MSYISKNLIEGECIVYKTTKHWTAFVWPCTIIFLLSLRSVPIGILLSLFWLLPVIIDYRTSEFGVTNRRIIIKSGFIRRISLETFLNRIEGVSVEQKILGRIFGYGTITFIGVGGTKNSFRKIKKPLELARYVQESIVVTERQDVTVS